MRGRGLLAALLLGAGLCFVPGLGYGEEKELPFEIVIVDLNYLRGEKASELDLRLLQARVEYMMTNPTSFLNVSFYDDPNGRFKENFPEGIDTKDKILVWVRDNRGVFRYKSRIALLELFKRHLETIYTFIDTRAAWDMNADIVAKFYSREGIPLGYFYQGEYHLWEK
jgi:hypothetical protein